MYITNNSKSTIATLHIYIWLNGKRRSDKTFLTLWPLRNHVINKRRGSPCSIWNITGYSTHEVFFRNSERVRSVIHIVILHWSKPRRLFYARKPVVLMLDNCLQLSAFGRLVPTNLITEMSTKNIALRRNLRWSITPVLDSIVWRGQSRLSAPPLLAPLEQTSSHFCDVTKTLGPPKTDWPRRSIEY